MAAGRVTITDIAKLANTSTATVSHYLNDKFDKMSPATRESIRRAIEQTGYVPGVQARSLAGKPTGIIAVLILNNTNIWAGQICSGSGCHCEVDILEFCGGCCWYDSCVRIADQDDQHCGTGASLCTPCPPGESCSWGSCG